MEHKKKIHTDRGDFTASYLRRVAQHKTVVAAAGKLGAVIGWGVAYVLFLAVVLIVGDIGLTLLTGQGLHSLSQALGLLVLVALPALALELFRPRHSK